MIEFWLILGFLVIWCDSVLALLISSWREEKRIEARGKDWR